MVSGVPEPYFLAAVLDLAALVYDALPHNGMAATSIVADRANARWCRETADGLRDEAARVVEMHRHRRNPPKARKRGTRTQDAAPA